MEFNFNPEPSFTPLSPPLQGREKFVDWEDALLLLIDSACDYGAVTILMLLPIHMHVCCAAAAAARAAGRQPGSHLNSITQGNDSWR